MSKLRLTFVAHQCLEVTSFRNFQESITRSLQLPYYLSETAFSQVGVFFDDAKTFEPFRRCPKGSEYFCKVPRRLPKITEDKPKDSEDDPKTNELEKTSLLRHTRVGCSV